MFIGNSTKLGLYLTSNCDQVERERSLKNKALLEKEEYRAHIHKLARALKRHQVGLS